MQQKVCEVEEVHSRNNHCAVLLRETTTTRVHRHDQSRIYSPGSHNGAYKFSDPPRVVHYDTACNLYKSVLLRAPWLAHCSKFVVDRFHYKCHTCYELFDPDAYHFMDADRTTTAESINARIEKTVPFIRFVKGENLTPFLNIRFALLNVATRYRRKYQVDDLEDADLWAFYG